MKGIKRTKKEILHYIRNAIRNRKPREPFNLCVFDAVLNFRICACDCMSCKILDDQHMYDLTNKLDCDIM